MHPDDIEKTAITTPFGLFEFLRMPFGLKNAGKTFQRFINEVTNALPDVFAYADDELVASNILVDYINALAEIFTRFEKFGLPINMKCPWIQHEIDFLGYTITSEGIQPQTARSQTLSELPEPTDYKELRRYMGMFSHVPLYSWTTTTTSQRNPAKTILPAERRISNNQHQHLLSCLKIPAKPSPLWRPDSLMQHFITSQKTQHSPSLQMPLIQPWKPPYTR